VAATSSLLVARAPITDRSTPVEAPRGELATANQEALRLARLTGGIMAGQVIVYAVPLFINGRIAQDQDLVLSVAAAVGLTRLALLVLFPLQAPLLPELTAAAARREMHLVRRSSAKLVGAALAAGLFGVLVVGSVGPWIVHVVMGGPAILPRPFLIELAAATLFLLVANALQTALIALNRQQIVLWGWVAGVVVMFLLFLLPFGVLTTGALAAMVGPLVTSLVFGRDVLLATRAAAPGPAGPDLAASAHDAPAGDKVLPPR
jgi:O-antigen/teichoic acid export membrane protein